jgi:hypothetical protein
MKKIRVAGLLVAAWLLAAPGLRAHPGTGIVVDRQGRVYFTDLKRIWRVDPAGGVQAVVSGKHCHALRLDERGRLEGEHVTYDSSAQKWWSSSWRLEDDGAVRDTVPPTEGFPFLFTPAVAGDGTRYFARVDNNRRDVSEIHRRAPDGKTALFVGGAYGFADGAGSGARFGPIGALAVGPGGALYLTDEASVRRVSASGEVRTIARGDPLLKPSLFARFFGGRFGKMMGLAVDERGTVFAANYGGSRVVRVTQDGRVTSVLDSDGGWAPSGVALSGADLYVLEYGTGDSVRVRRLRLSPPSPAVTLAVVRDGRPAHR